MFENGGDCFELVRLTEHGLDVDVWPKNKEKCDRMISHTGAPSGTAGSHDPNLVKLVGELSRHLATVRLAEDVERHAPELGVLAEEAQVQLDEVGGDLLVVGGQVARVIHEAEARADWVVDEQEVDVVHLGEKTKD